MPTFITEVLRLVCDIQHLNHLLPLNEQLMLHYLSPLWLEFWTQATAINNIDKKCCIKKPDSSITYLTYRMEGNFGAAKIWQMTKNLPNF